MSHVELGTTVRQIVLLEKTATSLALQISALKRDGVPAIALAGCEMARDAIKRDVNRWKRQIAKDYRDLPVVAWARGVHGLGNAITLVLGVAPPLTDFATVSKLWKYAGFAPGQGPKTGQNHKYSREIKSFMIKRIAEPCMKSRACPYRADYDARRELTATTHPEWTDGHSHNDALRIIAKSVLRDMWLVANGKEAKIGSEAVATLILRPDADLPPLSASDVGEAGARSRLDPTMAMPSTSAREKEGGPIASGTRIRSAAFKQRRAGGRFPCATHPDRAPLSGRCSPRILETT